MTGGQWASLIGVAGALVLAVSGLRARQLGANRLMAMALAWTGIFLLVAAVFVAVEAG